MKHDLPVIVLKGFVLLPNNDLKLDLKINKDVLETSINFNNNNVLVVTDIDKLEETTDISKLPKIGTIAKIKKSLELPNGMTRISLSGIKRAKIIEYINDYDIEAIVEEKEIKKIDSIEEKVLIERINKEIKEFVGYIPYISNSFINDINKIKDLNILTDKIVNYLEIGIDRYFEYLMEDSQIERSKMILDDIYEAKEMYQIEQNLDIKLKKQLDDDQKQFILREKIKLIKEELGEYSYTENDIENLKNRLENLKAPDYIKERILREIKRYSLIPSSSPELSIERNYIECLLELPWGKYTIDNDNLIEVREKLDATHDGLEQVKSRIIEYLGVKQLTNSLNGPILCLVGPPGVGKTTLAFSIAEAMNRKFTKISLGGINDEAEIIGHRRTYLGASPGRIITQIKKAKSANPVFLIDEIDKMTKSYKGDPASVLLEVLDPNQNKYFKDNYIEEEFDLSKVMFIATANYIEDIPEALKDRLEIVKLSGYTEFEKLKIAKNYLLPKICKDHGINYKYVEINDNIILKIIRNYTKEAGVRELERKLATIIRKIITSLAYHRININKVIITNKMINEYLGNPIYEMQKINYNEIGVVNALAYTKFGGDVLPIEVVSFKGTGNITLTGSLGDVMKESAIVALNYIKANYKYFDIDYEKLTNNDIHIHMPDAAINKDGPSAGIALTSALISLFKGQKISKDISFTGEITLTGKVLEIGGLKEKSIGALRCGIKKIYIPKSNKKDIDNLPNEVKENIEFICINDFKELYRGEFK